MDIADWLQALGLKQYETAFSENDVDAELLPALTEEDLKGLGVASIGHRRRLLNAIAGLHPEAVTTSNPSRSSRPGADEAASFETTAERRPLSVMFCDLIGSTALSSRLDPEDLREVIRTYQACVATTIEQFEGFIARYVGDGVLIYFGWPAARETDAERAVRAGLAVAAAISKAPIAGERLQVRIGIRTGLVVIGEPIGSGDSRQQTAVGETPNLAARLHSLAAPNQVVIDAATRRQIGGLFECRDLGAMELKGLPAAVPAWQAIAENRALGQFEALRSGTTPLVGREEEVELLLRRWAQAKAGNGRVVMVSAEPGVGKSRLADTISELIAAEPHTRLSYFCSPHQQDSALYPVIAQMERAAGFVHGDMLEVRLTKLQELLATADPWDEDVTLVAGLHGLLSSDFAQLLDLTPEQRKERTFEALLRKVERLSRQQPVLMLFDDIHWIDPSSRELLDRLIERVAVWPILLLILFRPEFQAPWTDQPHVTMLTLARLARSSTEAMVANVAGEAVLPAEIVAEIAERADGVPLFIEELTKAVLEAGARGAAGLSAMLHPAQSVPATLHASLLARFDRLGPAARDVAQTGAAIGREFGHGLLASIVDLPEKQLAEGLDRLAGAGLVFVRGTAPEASYLFKHALVQDAAYGSLLRTRRQGLHRRIVAALEKLFPEIVTAQPALLARHCLEAGLAEQAAAYWLQAGQLALARSAMVEAVAQLRKGLEALARLPDGPWRHQQELDLQVALRSALAATKGWSAPDVEKSLARAATLAEQLDRPEDLASMIVSRWMFHFVRSEHRFSLGLGERLEQYGKARNENMARLLGCHIQGVSRFYLGEFVAARVVLEQGLSLVDRAPLRIGGLSIDPVAALFTYVALTLASLGHIDQAQSWRDRALLEARRIKEPHTLARVLSTVTWFDWLIRSPMAHIEELLAFSTEHGFPFYLSRALAFRGRSLIALGQVHEGLALLTQGLADLRATGGVLFTPMLFTWLAEAHAILGHRAEAQSCLVEAASIIERTEERSTEADLLYRDPGDLLIAAGDRSGAERYYRQAIAVAEPQSAKLFQLRASTRLARLWQNQGKPAEAYDLLAPVYYWFTEGFDAPDLQDARALLDELA